jgi:hypothetical protein
MKPGFLTMRATILAIALLGSVVGSVVTDFALADRCQQNSTCVQADDPDEDPELRQKKQVTR